MSEDFGFQIVGDASKANAAIGQVLTQLDRIEAEARTAGGAMTSSFGSAGAAISKASAEARQSADAQKTLAQRMRGVGAELENQERMYQRIHGPAQRYTADLKALDTLLHQNAISAGQYAEQVTRLNRAIDGTPKPVARTAMPTAPSVSAGSSLMSGLGTGAAMLGVGFGAQQLVGIADGYTQIQNRLRQMTPDQAASNALFSELHGIANRTRSDLSSTVDAFAGMSRATKSLGLSQADTLKVTETLNKLVTASGKSAGESAAGLMQFSQALSSGRLQGDELRSVFENMPSLVDALMKSTGKTQAQLREMGSEGQITSKVMIEALQQAAGAADASLGKTIPTIGQSLTMLKNNILADFGPALQTMSRAAIAAMDGIGSAISLVSVPLKLLGDGLEAISDIGIDFGAGTAIGFLMGGPLGAAVGTAVETVGDYVGLWDDVGSAMLRASQLEEQYAARRTALTQAMQQGEEAVTRWHAEQGKLNLSLTLGASAADAFANATARMGREAALTAEEFRNLFDQTDPLTKLAGGGFRKGDAIDQFGAYVKNKSIDTTTADGANKMIATRKAAVTAAQQELRELEMTWQSVGHGTLTTDLYKQKKEQLLQVINGTTKAHGHARKAVDDYARVLHEILGPQQDAIRDLNVLGNLYMNGAINLEQYNRATQRHLDLLHELGITDAKSVTNGVVAAPVDYTAGIDTGAIAPATKMKIAAQDHEMLTKSWMDRMKELELANAQFANSFSPIGDAIKDAFTGGQLAAEKLDQTLRNVAFNMFKFMALQAAASLTGGGAGLAGAVLGGIFGSSPGMAHGGVVHHGTGGTDSQLVAIRKSPNEHMTSYVETPTQYSARMSGGGTGGGAQGVSVGVMAVNDEREITSAFQGAAGTQVTAVINRQWRNRNR